MISQSKIGNQIILRPVIANPLITEETIDDLINEIVRTGEEILRGIPFSN